MYKKIYDEVDRILNACYHQNGVVFGGFVRDYIIVDHLKDGKPQYKNIDLWFKDEVDLKLFLNDIKMYVKLKKNQIFTNEKTIEIKIFLSKFIPTDDFNVNACYYNNQSLYIPDEININTFIAAFLQRKCIISEKLRLYKDEPIYSSKNKYMYCTILSFPIITKIITNHKQRNKMMIKKGWKIYENYENYYQQNLKSVYKYIDKKKPTVERVFKKFILSETDQQKIEAYIKKE